MIINGVPRHLKKVHCPDCGNDRYTRVDVPSERCKSCAGKKKHLDYVLNGGISRGIGWKNGKGYVVVSIPVTDQYAPMGRIKGNFSQVLEHRLVMAQHLGRCLKPTELVHHINRIKNDNRRENLELLVGRKDHLPYIRLEQRIDELEKRVLLLEAENILLKSKDTQCITIRGIESY